MSPLEFLKSRSLPFAEMMGIVFVAADKDKVIAELEVTPKLCTRPTTIHGGALMAFADTLGAAGTILNLPEGAIFHSDRGNYTSAEFAAVWNGWESPSQ